MVSATFAEKGPPPSKEEVDWRVLSIVGFAIILGGLSSVGNTPRADAVVRVMADDDGAVPRCLGEGAVVRVADDDDGAVPRCPDGGTIVADVVLDVVDDGTLEDPTKW